MKVIINKRKKLRRDQNRKIPRCAGSEVKQGKERSLNASRPSYRCMDRRDTPATTGREAERTARMPQEMQPAKEEAKKAQRDEGQLRPVVAAHAAEHDVVVYIASVHPSSPSR